MTKVWQPLKTRVQSQLLKQGRCVGCTRSLATADRESSRRDEKHEVVSCSCRRIFIYNKQLNHYRRATITNIEKHLSDKLTND